MRLCNKRILLQSSTPAFFSVQRWKSKSKENFFQQYRRPSDAQEIARDYFDLNYGKLFKEEWPSIRCAMLSRKKYCAILNNFLDTKTYEESLFNSGAYDFIERLNKRAVEKCNDLKALINTIDHKVLNGVSEQEQSISEIQEQLETLESQLSIFEQYKSVCGGVKAYVYPKGNFTELKETVENLLHLSFFLDASSVLPVLALDPQPHDHILDLCAAPGGKLNIIIQALGYSAVGGIVANDVLSSRIARVKRVIRQFVPSAIDINQFIKTVSQNGVEWHTIETSCYSKVLVDVPCTTDRTSMFTPARDRDNIFSKMRKRERSRLPELQSMLLKNAILACQPGGTVVYSTCTASHLQNQFVVQYTVQEALQEHGIVCEIEDLKPLASLLEDEFHFHKDLSLGILVKPRIDNNYGPAYICKLRRLS